MRALNGENRFFQTPFCAFEVCHPLGSLWFKFEEVWPGVGGVNGIHKCCKGHHWIASEKCLAMVCCMRVGGQGMAAIPGFKVGVPRDKGVMTGEIPQVQGLPLKTLSFQPSPHESHTMEHLFEVWSIRVLGHPNPSAPNLKP
jgi:hypothetical protein